MKTIDAMTCLVLGHRWTHSRTRKGYRTCVRCLRREPDPEQDGAPPSHAD